MKILQVMAGAEHGGAEAAFLDMCLALHEAGETQEVAMRSSPARADALRAAGVPVHILPFGGKFDVFTPWRLARVIKKFQPHIVQTWMSRAAAHTPKWSASMGMPRYLVVARLGGYYKLKYFRNADYFITNTPGLKKWLAAQGADENKIAAVNNFVEFQSPSPPDIARASCGTPEGAKLALALGRLHESKALDTAIKAVAELPGVHLWIAGEGPERKRLESLIARLNAGNRIKLLGWRRDRDALFRACDFCVFPSRIEPFGNVFAQSWAHGKPLVVSAAEGPMQYVRDGEDALVFAVDDAESLKQKIKLLINNDNLAKKLAENGQRRFGEEFSREKTVAAYLAFYNEIRAREGL